MHRSGLCAAHPRLGVTDGGAAIKERARERLKGEEGREERKKVTVRGPFPPHWQGHHAIVVPRLWMASEDTMQFVVPRLWIASRTWPREECRRVAPSARRACSS